jgi:uncharacterized lipoprotein YmbA
MKRRVDICWGLMCLAVLGTGCVSVGGQSAASRYYVLVSASQESTAAPEDTAAGPVIGIRPVEIPKYLDRPQIVTHASDSEVRVGEFVRWAEPLDVAIQCTLAENLAVFVPTDRVVTFPWRSTLDVDYEIDLRVLEFSLGPGGNVALVARWTVLDNALGRNIPITLSRFERPAGAVTGEADYDAVVDAMSEALQDLSREICSKIRSGR